MAAKKRNPQDATLRNVRAANKRLEKNEAVDYKQQGSLAWCVEAILELQKEVAALKGDTEHARAVRAEIDK